jgi:hypothetical protein
MRCRAFRDGPGGSARSGPHLRTIYERHAQDVLGLCGCWLQDPDAAMDAAQSTFEALIEDLPTLRDPDKLRPCCAESRNTGARRYGGSAIVKGSFPSRTLRTPSTKSRRAAGARPRSIGCSMPSRQALPPARSWSSISCCGRAYAARPWPRSWESARKTPTTPPTRTSLSSQTASALVSTNPVTRFAKIA